MFSPNFRAPAPGCRGPQCPAASEPASLPNTPAGQKSSQALLGLSGEEGFLNLQIIFHSGQRSRLCPYLELEVGPQQVVQQHQAELHQLLVLTAIKVSDDDINQAVEVVRVKQGLPRQILRSRFVFLTVCIPYQQEVPTAGDVDQTTQH